MFSRRKRILAALATTLVVGAVVLACNGGGELSPTSPSSDGTGTGGDRPFMAPIGNILGSPCYRATNPHNSGDPDKDHMECVDLRGPGLSLNVPVSHQSYQFQCEGVGLAKNITDSATWNTDDIPVTYPNTNHVLDIGVLASSDPNDFTDVTTDPSNFAFTVIAKHPGTVTLHCRVDSPVRDVTLTLTGQVTLDHMVIPQTQTYVVAGTTLQLTTDLYDNYGYKNVMTRPGVTWSSSDTTKAKVSATGVVTGIARTTTPITITATSDAASGSKVATKALTVEACSAINSNTTGPIQLVAGVPSPQIIETLTCDSHINAASTPLTWTSNPTGIVTVNTSSPYHTATLTGTAAGSTTVSACTSAALGSLCSSWVVNVAVSNIGVSGNGLTISMIASTNRTDTFTVTNIGVGGPATFVLSCATTGPLSCPSGVSPSSVTLSPGQHAPVTVNVVAGTTSGSATMTVTATGNGHLTQNYYVYTYAVGITSSDTGTIQVGPNAYGYVHFTLKNFGTASGTSVLSCTNYGNVTCAYPSPQSFTLNPGDSGTGTILWNTQSTTGWGQLALSATPYGAGYTWNFAVTGGPLTVSFNTGPASVKPNAQCEWIAQANGGSGPLTYGWTVDGVSVPSSNEVMDYVNSGQRSFTVGVTVTDSQNATASTSVLVTTRASAPNCVL